MTLATFAGFPTPTISSTYSRRRLILAVSCDKRIHTTPTFAFEHHPLSPGPGNHGLKREQQQGSDHSHVSAGMELIAAESAARTGTELPKRRCALPRQKSSEMGFGGTLSLGNLMSAASWCVL